MTGADETKRETLAAILSAYGLELNSLSPIATGNINLSYRVTAGDDRDYLLQRVNPLFSREIHTNIEVVTRHLQEKGLLTPLLISTRQGELYLETEGGIWRLFDYIPGVTRETVTDTATAREAGRLLGRFHRALLDLDYRIAGPRLGVHDTGRHLQALDSALRDGHDHPRIGSVQPLGRQILGYAADLPDLPKTPERKVHGDPKISNILFDPANGRARCLVDLDTLAEMPLYLELGDAMRSWCNPAGEDSTEARFSRQQFIAAAEGYAGGSGGFLLAEEWRAVLPATYVIYLELAARFCADAINESYFAWDPGRFTSRSEHNELRARSQLQAAVSLRDQYRQAEAELAEVLS